MVSLSFLSPTVRYLSLKSTPEATEQSDAAGSAGIFSRQTNQRTTALPSSCEQRFGQHRVGERTRRNAQVGLAGPGGIGRDGGAESEGGVVAQSRAL
eukprot:309172-Pyramimonas_sp.AAC.1